MVKALILLNVFFILIILTIQTKFIYPSFEGRSNLLTNHYETNLMKGKFGGEIIQLNYLSGNNRYNDDNSGEETLHAHKYIIPSNFTESEPENIIDLTRIPHVSDLNSSIFNMQNQIVGFLTEEKTIE